MKKAAARNGRGDGRRRVAKESLEELKKRVAAMSPLEAAIFEISDSVPMADWRKLPRDLSYNHDHYAYGVPKRKR